MDVNRSMSGTLRTSPNRGSAGASGTSKSGPGKVSVTKHSKSKSAKITSLHTSLNEAEVSRLALPPLFSPP